MTLTDLLPWLAFGVATIGGAVAWWKVVFLDRAEAHQHELTATQQQDMEERKQVLATAKFFSEQVPALQHENETRRAEVIVLREQVAACDTRIATVEANAREAHKVLLLRQMDELAERDRVISSLTRRLAKYEPNGVTV